MDTSQYNEQEAGEQDEQQLQEQTEQEQVVELEQPEAEEPQEEEIEQPMTAQETEQAAVIAAIGYLRQVSANLTARGYLSTSVDLVLCQYLTLLEDCTERLSPEQWAAILGPEGAENE